MQRRSQENLRLADLEGLLMYSIHESTNLGGAVNSGIPMFLLQVIEHNVAFLVLGRELMEVIYRSRERKASVLLHEIFWVWLVPR